MRWIQHDLDVFTTEQYSDESSLYNRTSYFQIVLEGIGRLICHHRKEPHKPRNTPDAVGTNELDCETMTMLQNLPNGHMHAARTAPNAGDEQASCDGLPESVKLMMKGLDQQVGEIKSILQKVEFNMEQTHGRESARNEIKYQWHRIGLILDRFFFFFYIGLIIISLSMLFPKPS